MGKKYAKYIKKSSPQYTLSEVLRCTPYTSAYTNAPTCGLNEYEFMRNLFVSPFFEERLNELEIQLKEDGFVDGEESETIEDEIKELKRISSQKSNFEKSLLENTDPVVRYICAYSGSGKSTYLGNLFLTFRSQKHITHIFDVSATNTASIDLFGQTYENSNPSETLSKFLFKIINDIVELLSKDSKETFVQYRNRIKKYSDFYFQKIYEHNDDFAKCFKCFERYITENSDTVESYVEFRCLIRKFFSDKLKVTKSKNNQEKIISLIKLFLSFFVMLKLPEMGKSKICFIALDSIEHYIGDDEVYDSDIIEICKIFENVLTLLSKQYALWFGEDLVFSKRFRFVIALRDTTEKLLPTKDAEDYSKYEINISDWFAPAKIVEKRLEYFTKIGVESVKSITAKAIKTVLEDDARNFSKLNRISKMHNQNNRRLSEYLCDVLTEQYAEQYLKLYEKAEEYNTLFRQAIENKNKKEIIQKYRNLADVYRRASRDLIVHLLFKSIDDKKYFDNIMVKGDYAQLGKSIARRILTYIAAKKPFESLREVDNYIGFNDLLKGAFQKGGPESQEKISDGEISDISRVLYNLSKSRKEETHWCQNTVIKFNDKQYNAPKLTKKMISIYKNEGEQDEDDQKNYGVKITSSGRFFLNRMSDYEYFICRYIKDSKSLFDEANLEKINNEKFKCLVIIKEIQKRAFECINKIIEQDELFFSPNLNYAFMYSELGSANKRGYLYVNGSNNECTHIERLIDSHISYLDYYRNYLIDLYKTNKTSLTENEFRFISKEILNVITLYVDKLKKILSISSKNDNYKVYYIGNNRTMEDGKQYYEKFESNLKTAEKNLLNYYWIKKFN